MSHPIGIIGGSGLYVMEGLKVMDRQEVETPFGKPSGPLVSGALEGVAVAFLARHGEGHRLLPNEVPYRANLWALKQAGVQIVLSFSAVGSLQAAHPPGSLRIPDQFVDRTTRRESTFFGDGLVAHVGFADPTSAWLRRHLLTAGQELGLPISEGGTYLTMEGPQFSTRAESRLHQTWGMDFVGMTQGTEAKLAREAELVYATVALVTDYDAWRNREPGAEAHDLLATLAANIEKSHRLLRHVLQRLTSGAPEDEPALQALATALVTRPDHVPPTTRARLKLLIEKYGY
jgi:5'-methylthioadenosine phosphorylase